MKKTMYFLCFAFVLFAVACKKDNSTDLQNLVPSKTSDIKKGEPVAFSLKQGDSVSAVIWSVNPANNAVISAKGNKASIIFNANGNYTVTALFNGVTSNCNVVILDTVGTSPQDSIIAIAQNETINITASKVDSLSLVGLRFSATTKNSYKCAQSLNADVTTGDNLSLKYTGITLKTSCTGNTMSAATANSVFFSFPSAGTKTISIVVNGATYSGTIVKTGSSYTINWTNTNAVTISPTTL
ncbi:MAG: hypothetical protein QM726_23890 [Chitinophagaceae bacterium]